MTPKKSENSRENDEENGNDNMEDEKKMTKRLEEEMKDKDGIMEDKNYEAEILEKEKLNLKDLDENRVIGAEISNEMKRSYIDYAMSVIVSRALPSCEDGLKPVHRRILYAMKLMGLEKGMTKKCARIVGDCMGKFHPHGDMAIYDALVRMAQDFSLRYPLIHGQGNFGSIDADSAAASRYCVTGDSLIVTEKGLQKIKDISNNENISLKILSKNKKISLASRWFDSGNHETIKIITGKGYSLIGTKNHPILVMTKNDLGMPIFNWKLLEQIREGDIAIIDRREDDFWPEKEVILNNYFPEKQNGHQHARVLPEKLNDDLSFLLGALVSEGFISKNKIEFCNTDEELIKNFEERWKIVFPDSKLHKFEKNPSSYGKKKYYRLECHCRYTIEFLRNVGLEAVKSNKKRIPFILFQSPKHVVASFLKAYFEGDGSVYYGKKIFKVGCYSVSEKLIEELQTILLRFGIESAKRYDRGKFLHLLNIYGKRNILRFYKHIGFFSKRKFQKLEFIVLNYKKDSSLTDYVPFISDFIRGLSTSSFISKNNFDRYSFMEKNYKRISEILLKRTGINYASLFEYFLTYNYLFEPIIKVENAGINRVYSLKVESDCHSFISNGFISHNTEAKLAKIAVELLADIDKNTVKFAPNFDNSLEEPVVLPGKVPNLLINGSSGIAVGMATNIPPHNLVEVCDAISACIDKPKVTTEELMNIIKGPDFPTGGVIVAENLKNLYETGRGGFVVRGRLTTEEEKGGHTNIIITEIPYQVNKSELVKQIAELIHDKKLPDVSDIRDESSRGKIRVVIELKKGADSKFTINRLYKSTNLQTKFDAVLIALVNGVPQLLKLKQILEVYIDYRKKIIRNKTKFELKEAEDREHIVQGLLIALKNIEEIIEAIKKSREGTAEKLMDKFKLSKKQAEAILEMKLRQLSALEHEKLKKEEDELKARIKELKEILENENLILKLIKKDLSELKREFGDERRSKLISKVAEFAEKDLVKKEDVIISVTDKGYIKRMPFKAYREQKRGGKGVIGADLSTGDFVKQLIPCSTHDYLLLFTQRGRVFWLKAYQIPETQRYGRGQAIVNMLNLKEDNISSIISVKEFKNGFLFLATKLGVVKKMKLEMFANPRASGLRAINLPLDNSDNLIAVSIIQSGQEVMMTTAGGQAIKFNSDEVRDMGRASYGVTGIKLEKGDEVVSLVVISKDDKEKKTETVLTLTRDGYGKRSLIDDYRLTGRACKGVINLKVTGKNGKVVRTISVKNKDQIIVTTEKGIMIKTPVRDIRVMGRATQGVRIIKLHEGDKVSDVAKLSSEEETIAAEMSEEKAA